MDVLDKYAGLLGVARAAELGELKERYGEMRSRFEEQLRSRDPASVRRGQKNLDLLDRAYQALAAAARQQEPDEAPLPMSIEIGSHRAGFNIKNAEGFGWMDKRHLVKQIEYRKIEEISRLWFLPMVFVVRHRQPDVLPTVILNGIGLGAKIRRLNEEHHLGLRLNY